MKRYCFTPPIAEKARFLAEMIENSAEHLKLSADEDAKVGHKTADTSFFGYKTHLAMSDERIITAATITTGEKSDGKELEALVEKSRCAGMEVETVVGDTAYSGKENLELSQGSFALISKLNPNITQGTRAKEDVEKCRCCPMSEGCYKLETKSKTYSVTIKQDIHKAHMAFQETDKFKEKARERYKIEAKNNSFKPVKGCLFYSWFFV